MTFYIRPYPNPRTRRNAAAFDGGSRHDHLLDVNIREEEGAFVLNAPVPGLKAKDLKVEVLADVVRIEGNYSQSEEKYLLQELPIGSFHRVLRLPSEIEADRVEARIDDGLLSLRLPKAESALPRKIKIAAK